MTEEEQHKKRVKKIIRDIVSKYLIADWRVNNLTRKLVDYLVAQTQDLTTQLAQANEEIIKLKKERRVDALDGQAEMDECHNEVLQLKEEIERLENDKNEAQKAWDLMRDDLLNKISQLQEENKTILVNNEKLEDANQDYLCEIGRLQEENEKLTDKIKEAYSDGFNDDRFDFDLENYTEDGLIGNCDCTDVCMRLTTCKGIDIKKF